MTQIIIVIVVFYFVYSILMSLIQNSTIKKVLRIYAENNLLGDLKNNSGINLNIEQKPKKMLLPVTLGIMGFSLGGIIVAIWLNNIQYSGMDMSYKTRELIMVSIPIFCMSIGLLAAYFIEQKQNK